MPARTPAVIPPPDGEKSLSERVFSNERKDNQEYNGFTFEFCTFERVGLRGSKFIHCVFRHCEFRDCYFVGAKFEHCNFVGSYFEKCNFSWAEFPNSQLDYTRFAHCAPVLAQIIDHKPKDPQGAAKFFRNLAYEQRILGNWQEVDRLIHQSYRERERHYWFAVVGQNEHYRKRYAGFVRARYGARYFFSMANRFLWGYGVSWRAFATSVALFWLIILPLFNIMVGQLNNFSGDLNTVRGSIQYIRMIYRITTQSFFPFVPASSPTTQFILPFAVVTGESLLGTLFIALFASLLFRSASKGL